VLKPSTKSGTGQTRRFDYRPATSGVPPTPDISLHRAHCRDVPLPDLTVASFLITSRSAASAELFINPASCAPADPPLWRSKNHLLGDG
jgi:hypothetical protein